MALDIKIKTNSEAIKKRFNRIERKFPSIIDKGILQGGFQLLDIIRTKQKKVLILMIDHLKHILIVIENNYKERANQ